MIICAAIRVKIPTSKEPFDTVVIPCWRHATGYEILHALCPDKRLHIGAEEGFIDEKGNFLNRTEAYRKAQNDGQLPITVLWYKGDHGDTELYSEDLY